MKLFVGIVPPKETLDELRDALRLYNKHKRSLVTPPIDQFHITLKYIGGNVSEQSYEIIQNALNSRQSEFGPVKVDLSGLQFGFAHDSFPKVLMASVGNNDEIQDVANHYHQIIKDLKLKDTIRIKGKFSTTFHITLARIKPNAPRSTAKQIKRFTNSLEVEPFSPFTVDTSYLIESIVRPAKPVLYVRRNSYKT
jgi:2'-5' RNA ligase